MTKSTGWIRRTSLLTSYLAALCLLSTGALAEEEKSDEAADDKSTKSEISSHELSHVLQQRAQPATASQPGSPEPAAPTRATRATQPEPATPARAPQSTRPAPAAPVRTPQSARPAPASPTRAPQAASPEPATPAGSRAQTAPTQPATRGNPDRPVITGRAPSPGGASGDRPSESLSLNFEKVRMTSVKIRSTHHQQSRVIVRGWDNKFYALPDGTYSNDTGQQLVISAGALDAPASSDVVLKGKKILQNAVPDGRFGGPGGAWLEVSGGKIVSVGGQLERHTPPPYIDVTGDDSITLRGEEAPGGKKKGNVETTFKVEKAD